MNVSQLQRLQQTAGTDRGQALPQPRDAEGADGKDFSDTLGDAIEQVDASQKAADENVEAFVAGEEENLHDVMISMNQAKLHFQLMTEVRNKALETYRELMRMQI